MNFTVVLWVASVEIALVFSGGSSLGSCIVYRAQIPQATRGLPVLAQLGKTKVHTSVNKRILKIRITTAKWPIERYGKILKKQSGTVKEYRRSVIGAGGLVCHSWLACVIFPEQEEKIGREGG